MMRRFAKENACRHRVIDPEPQLLLGKPFRKFRKCSTSENQQKWGGQVMFMRWIPGSSNLLRFRRGVC